jgi:hypothetical protein
MKTIVRLGAAALLLAGGAASGAAAQDVSVHEGEVGAGSARTSGGLPYADWDVWLDAGQRVRVTVEARSEGIDPMVEIYPRDARSGDPLASDDDSGGYPNARLDFAAPRAGVYSFRVLSFLVRGGRYAMRIERLPTASAAMPAIQPVYEGRFNNGVPRDSGGRHYRDFAVDLRSGEQVLLRLDSSSFDPVLRLFPAGGENGQPIALDDDGGEGLNAMLLFTAPRNGRYTVRASQLAHGDGPWTLRMNRVE